jgi:hypothetical protein
MAASSTYAIGFEAELVLAAETFVMGDEMRTAIASHHWFTDVSATR